jgi:hypothetical protein
MAVSGADSIISRPSGAISGRRSAIMMAEAALVPSVGGGARRPVPRGDVLFVVPPTAFSASSFRVPIQSFQAFAAPFPGFRAAAGDGAVTRAQARGDAGRGCSRLQPNSQNPIGDNDNVHSYFMPDSPQVDGACRTRLGTEFDGHERFPPDVRH